MRQALGLWLMVWAVAMMGACSRSPEQPSRPAPPAKVRLAYQFEPGQVQRYQVKTMERGRAEITIEMDYRWRVLRRLDTGHGEVEVEFERYQFKVFPYSDQYAEAEVMNRGLKGARFRMDVSPDGRQVRHLGHEGLPAISAAQVEALRTTVRNHILRLPSKAISAGERWVTEFSPPAGEADGGGGSVTSRSQWRVLAVRSQGGKKMVELVCLTNMVPEPLKVQGATLRTETEFHYSYLWNATSGQLDSLTSSGKTKSWLVGQNQAEAGEPTRTAFEGRVRLLPN
jgi:hypothetical protein